MPRRNTLRGLTAIKRGHNARAIEDLTTSLRLDPAQARAFALFAGLAYRRMGQHDWALADFLDAFLLEPRYLRAYCKQRGMVHTLSGHHAEAAADFLIVSQFEPDRENAQIRVQQALRAYRTQAQTSNGHTSIERIEPDRQPAARVPKPRIEPSLEDTSFELAPMEQAAPTEPFELTETELPAAVESTPEAPGEWTLEINLADENPAPADRAETTDWEASEEEPAEQLPIAGSSSEEELEREREAAKKIAEERARARQREETLARARAFAKSRGGTGEPINWVALAKMAAVAAAVLLVIGAIYWMFSGPQTLKADETYKEYAQETSKANKKWGGQFVKMTGKVTKVVDEEEGTTRWVFQTAEDATWYIECKFARTPDEAEKVKNLQPGQEVTVLGKLGRKQGPDSDLVITSCTILAGI